MAERGYFVLPSLWVEGCQFAHTSASSAQQAVGLLRNPGVVVVVPDIEIARQVLVLLGYSVSDINFYISRARVRQSSGFPD